jgi:hypothetical protein
LLHLIADYQLNLYCYSMIQVSSGEVSQESVGVVIEDRIEGRSRSLVVDVLINNNHDNVLQRLTVKFNNLFLLEED